MPASPAARRVLEPSWRRLLGPDTEAFVAGLQEASGMAVIDDTLVGAGSRPGTLGSVGSFFAMSFDGRLFVAMKSGPHGLVITRRGDASVIAPWGVRHPFLEFANLDE